MTSVPTTVVSTKGQVVLPKDVRERRNWPPGTRLVVEETAEGVLLRPGRPTRVTTLDDVVGMVKYHGPPHTIEEMNQGVLDGVAEDWARFEKQSREDRDRD